jgi:hypothetical protein
MTGICGATGPDAGPHDAFEDAAEEVALAKALVARTAERGVIGDRIFQVEVAKPPIREGERCRPRGGF